MRTLRPFGPIAFELIGSHSHCQRYVSTILGDCSTSSARAIGSISVTRIQSKLDFAPSNDTRLEFSLADGVTYSYNPSTSCYSVTINDFAFGIIDLKHRSAKWEYNREIRPRSFFHLFVLDPLSLFLPAYDIMICHAAAIVYNGRATLILGNSGAGKSTLTFLLSTGGDPKHKLYPLSDDTVLLEFKPQGAVVWPIPSGFGLDPEILHRSGSHFNAPVLQRSHEKMYVQSLPDQANDPPYPIDSLVFLRPTFSNRRRYEHTLVTPLDKASTVKQLLNSQTLIPTPHVLRRFNLFSKLSEVRVSTELQFQCYCDPETARTLIVGDKQAADE